MEFQKARMEQLQVMKDSAVNAVEEIDVSLRKQVLFMQFYLLFTLIPPSYQNKIQKVVLQVIHN